MKSTWFADKRRYEIAKMLMDGHSEHRTQQVFRDFIRMCALTLLQRAHQTAKGWCQKTEDEVLALQGRYPKWKTTFAPAFSAIFVEYQKMLSAGMIEDFIGAMYEELGASNAWHGQFFTPMPICRVMAQMTLGTQEEFEANFAKDPRRVRINEPACGAGATMLGIWEIMLRWNVPPSAVYFFGIDLDPMCVDMAYIQCSLYGMPATIYNANTLTNPSCEGAPAYTTPMARMFPLRGECGMNVAVANPPFGGKVDTNELHWTLGGKGGLAEAKEKEFRNERIGMPVKSPSSEKPKTSPRTDESKPPIRRLAIRDR